MAIVNSLNYPVPVTCVRCGNEHAELLPSAGDRNDYRCPTCGEFSVAGTKERLFELGTEDPRTASFVVDQTGRCWLQ